MHSYPLRLELVNKPTGLLFSLLDRVIPGNLMQASSAVCFLPCAVWLGTLLELLSPCTSKGMTVSGYRLFGGF